MPLAGDFARDVYVPLVESNLWWLGREAPVRAGANPKVEYNITMMYYNITLYYNMMYNIR